MGGPYIVPLDLGGSTVEKCSFYLRRYIGEKVHSHFMAEYIGGAKKKVLVDTGPPNMERYRTYHPLSRPDPRKPEQEIEVQLAEAGIKPEDIEVVILTHLHWDHTGNIPKFPNAEFIVSDVELNFAMNPLPPQRVAYEALQAGMKPLHLDVMQRLRTVELKEVEIVEGVRMIPLPGHSPGSMGVVVETEKGPYVITGDAVFTYENLEGDPKENLKFLMTGIYIDMAAMWKSFESIDEIVKGDYTRVLPGHDTRVLEKKRYP